MLATLKSGCWARVQVEALVFGGSYESCVVESAQGLTSCWHSQPPKPDRMVCEPIRLGEGAFWTGGHKSLGMHLICCCCPFTGRLTIFCVELHKWAPCSSHFTMDMHTPRHEMVRLTQGGRSPAPAQPPPHMQAAASGPCCCEPSGKPFHSSHDAVSRDGR